MLEQLSPAASIVVGIVLLLAGRRLFWLALGTAGFVVALGLALHYLETDSQLVLLGLALVAGVAGALLAVFLQRLAIAVAGFLAGGWLGMTLWTQFAGGEGLAPVFAFLIAGVLAAVFSATLFGLALVVVSSLFGAWLIVEGIGLAEPMATILLLVLTLAGSLIQFSFRRRRER